MLKRILAALTSVLALSGATALEKQFSGDITAETGTPLPYAEGKGEFTEAALKSSAELYVYPREEVTFYIKGQAVYDKLGYTTDTFDFSTDDGKAGLILKEAWFDYNTEYVSVRIGRQINSWGNSDIISVTDVLCPKNYTGLSIFDTSDAYLGIDTVRLSAKHDVYSVDFYWIPFVRSTVIPVTSSHPFQKILKAETEPMNIHLTEPETKENSLRNAEYGIKASSYWKYADVSLYGFYGWERIGTQWDIDDDLGIVTYPKRMTMIGADASIPVKDVVVRLEAAFFPESCFPFTDLESLFNQSMVKDEVDTYEKHHRLSGLAGVDWMPSGWILSAQYSGDFIEGDTDFIGRKNYIHLATLAASRSFFKDTLAVSLAGAVQFEEWNNILIANAAYSANDALTFTATVYCLNILTDIEYDFFKDYKNWGGVTLGAKYSF